MKTFIRQILVKEAMPKLIIESSNSSSSVSSNEDVTVIAASENESELWTNFGIDF